MKNTIILIALFLVGLISISMTSKNNAGKNSSTKSYPKALADYGDFKVLVNEVEDYRSQRLIDLNTFLAMSEKDDVLILDTRSKNRYNRKHLKGAVHLNFNDFTQESLAEVIPPDSDMKILIYCNNNFEGDQVDFASKVAEPAPRASLESETLMNRKSLMLALNVPTFINLYGYGYREIYELDELVNVNDPRIEFEGSQVR